MKKLILSIAIVSAITVGVGVVTFASETNDKNVIEESSDCPYYNEENRNNEFKEGYGFKSKGQDRGRCGGSGYGMRNRGNL